MSTNDGAWRRPRLETERLVLIPLRPRDALAVFAAVDESRAALRRWLPFPDQTREPADTLAFIRRMSRSRRDLVWGVWIRPAGRRAPRRYCGNLGLHTIARDNGTAVMGYWIRRSAAGHGFATEAAAAVLLWAFGELGLARVGVEAATGNAASRRIIAKLGFVHEGVLRQMQALPGRSRRLDWHVHGMIRRDLRAGRARLVALCGRRYPWVRGGS